jgi:hypothetical protein
MTNFLYFLSRHFLRYNHIGMKWKFLSISFAVAASHGCAAASTACCGNLSVTLKQGSDSIVKLAWLAERYKTIRQIAPFGTGGGSGSGITSLINEPSILPMLHGQ